MHLQQLKKHLEEHLNQAARKFLPAPPPSQVEPPRDPAYGDLASPLALQAAKVERKNPMEIAERLAAFCRPLPDYLLSVEPVSPGFLNFRLNPEVYRENLLYVLKEGKPFFPDVLKDTAFHLEFVSANPTGPLNVVSGRAAALGAALSALWETCGAKVHREYYINDAGVQARLFGESLLALFKKSKGLEAEIPEGGYGGAYLEELLEELRQSGKIEGIENKSDPQGAEVLAREAMDRVVEEHRRVLEKYGVFFHEWFSERRRLHDTGKVRDLIAELRKRNMTQEKDGALWLALTRFGAVKDEVLVKKDGALAYFAADLAYHMEKFRHPIVSERPRCHIVDIWGPDHHGHIQRMKTALAALVGENAPDFTVLIAQQVNLIQDGRKFKMSKREGRFIALEELLAEVGLDAARWFFLMRASSSPLDFDLELAKKQNDENPVYYVQYAHARLCSLFQKATESGLTLEGGEDLSLLKEPEELQLLRRLFEFPQTLEGAALKMEPHRLAAYLHGLASEFHLFYTRHRIIGASEGEARARLALCVGVQRTLKAGLAILGVQAPQRM